MLNGILFPKTISAYSPESSFGRIVYIPRDPNDWEMEPPNITSDIAYKTFKSDGVASATEGYSGKFFPCLYLRSKKPSSKVMIFFHGNAEDIVSSLNLIRMVRRVLPIHVFSIEYQGYGVYEGSASAESIIEDADLLIEYIIKVHHRDPSDLIVFGRSIGSGPASYIAANHNIHSLILMSPFTSIRAMAKRYVGSALKFLIAERFENANQLKNSRCPIFLIHGKKDDIVPYTHSVDMWKSITAPGVLNLPPHMTHSSFAFFDDFVKPLKYFYDVIGLDNAPKEGDTGIFVFPKKLFMPFKKS